MATGIERALSRLGNNSKKSPVGRGERGRRPSRVQVASNSSLEDLSLESTPLSVRAQVDYSTDLRPTRQIRTHSNLNSTSSDGEQEGAHLSPEDEIKVFAFRLASMGKMASGVVNLAFIFATVVILGGFATSLTVQDFTVVSVIICAEALRIFTRSHELEWQMVKSRQETRAKYCKKSRSSTESGEDLTLPSSAGDLESTSTSTSGADDSSASRAKGRINFFKWILTLGTTSASHGEAQNPRAHDEGPRAYRQLSTKDVSIVSESVPIVGPIVNKLLRPPFMRALLYILQLQSATACIALSIWRLQLQEFCFRNKDPSDTILKAVNETLPMNQNTAVNELGNLLRSKGDRCQGYYKNVVVCLNLFLAMAMLEASLFLLEKGYFEFQWTFGKLLTKTQEKLSEEKQSSKESGKRTLLEEKPVDSLIVEKFYYTVYTNCLNGSILDGLNMSLVAYGIQWVQSDDLEQQLIGARLLCKFVSPRRTPKGNDSHTEDADPRTEDALRRLSRTPGIMNRLMEMLSWNSKQEKELVCEIASIVKCLVAYDHNWSRLSAVPGALDAVVSILIPGPSLFPRKGESTGAFQERRKNNYSKQLHLQLMGLKILRSLCRSFACSLHIGETRGLLPILVLFIQPQGSGLRYVEDRTGFAEDSRDPSEEKEDEVIEKSRWKVYKTSLQVLSCLAANKSNSGVTMRKQIAGVVSVLKNLRDTIEHCGPRYSDRPYLLELAIDILRHLALEDGVRRSIGATGGMIRLLFNAFQAGLQDDDAVQISKERSSGSIQKERATRIATKQNQSNRAGKVLSRLMLHSEENCSALLELEDEEGSSDVVNVMVESFSRGEEDIAVSAAEILLRVLKYADEDTKRKIALRGGLKALQNISDPISEPKHVKFKPKSVVYEVSLGLWARAVEALALSPDKGSDSDVVSRWIDRTKTMAFLSQLVKNLQHSPTTSEVPKIRRYSLGIIIALIKKDDYFLQAFARLGLRAELLKTLDTVSEVEDVILFSGLMAYDRHSEDIRHLVLRCIAALGRTMSPQSPSPISGVGA